MLFCYQSTLKSSKQQQKKLLHVKQIENRKSKYTNMARRKRQRHRSTIIATNDVTLNDFANNKNAVSRVGKNFAKPSVDTEAVDDIDDDADEATTDITEDLATEDHHESLPNKTTRRTKFRSKKAASSVASNDEDDGKPYLTLHVDIWFLIAERLDPSDVGSFARICTQTAYVCQTAKFWNDLYRRAVAAAAAPDHMPERLQPDCMTRLSGLRPCTIRALFYVHEPFVKRLPVAERQDVETLLRRECVANWVTQVKGCWHFCFKLRRKIEANSRLGQAQRRRWQFRNEHVRTDIYHNPEESCKLLVVSV